MHCSKTPVEGHLLWDAVCTSIPVDVVQVDVSILTDSFVPLSLHVQGGNTPLLISAQKGQAEIARFLLWNGSNVQEENNVSRLERMPSACGFYLIFNAIFWSIPVLLSFI